MAIDSLSLSVRKSERNELPTLMSKMYDYVWNLYVRIWWHFVGLVILWVIFCGIRQYISINFIEEVTFE